MELFSRGRNHLKTAINLSCYALLRNPNSDFPCGKDRCFLPRLPYFLGWRRSPTEITTCFIKVFAQPFWEVFRLLTDSIIHFFESSLVFSQRLKTAFISRK